MADVFHYPPDVFALLVDVVPLLCRSKPDVILFLRGAGVANEDLSDVAEVVRLSPDTIRKHEIVRRVLTKLNDRGDSGLAPRREIIKRVVEFEEFSTCWPSDQLRAKGLQADLRKTVNVKDSFTRMKRERDAERDEKLARARAGRAAAAEKRANIERVSARLSALFGMDDQPHVRGMLLESVLNDLFHAYGIRVREAFCRRDPDSALVLEQIDGVIELDGLIYLVEMKWLTGPVGMNEFSRHLVRLFTRANACGIFISSSDFTEPVLRECTGALNQKTIFLCSLREIVLLLQRQADLVGFLKRKSQAAIVEKNPYMQILS